MGRVSAALFVSLTWAALVVPPAFAQPAAAASEALFRAGREAMQQGDAPTACAKFHESYRLDRALGTLLNIAVCEEALGELSSAWQHYQDVIHELPENDERLVIARQHMEQLDPRLPRVTVRLEAGAPEDTRVSIGPVELGPASFDTPLPMDPGLYSVRATASGREPGVFTLDLHEGDRSEIVIAPGAVVPEAPVEAESSPALAPAATARPVAPAVGGAAASDAGAGAPSLRKGIGYGLLGAGAAAAVVAAVTGALALDRAATARDHCPNKLCDSEGFAASRSGQTLQVTSLISLGGGVVAAGAGLYLLLVTPKSDRAVALTPALSRHELGLHVSGRLW